MLTENHIHTLNDLLMEQGEQLLAAQKMVASVYYLKRRCKGPRRGISARNHTTSPSTTSMSVGIFIMPSQDRYQDILLNH